ncbi:MAG TPA: EutN/CcmL family microcompartment protein [Bacilli bacterium]
MILGKVVGSLVSTRKHDKLVGAKFLIVRPLYTDEDGVVVAVDAIGAGIGDKVIISTGSSARIAAGNPESVADAIIVGIVDQIRLDEANDRS